MGSPEIWDDYKEARKERQRARRRKNLDAIKAAGVRYQVTNNGETFLFRRRGGIKADFYPSTGRWCSDGVTYSGGAAKFLQWWQEQRA